MSTLKFIISRELKDCRRRFHQQNSIRKYSHKSISSTVLEQNIYGLLDHQFKTSRVHTTRNNISIKDILSINQLQNFDSNHVNDNIYLKQKDLIQKTNYWKRHYG
mmetsp:Transcript_9968/g.14108  ORF Transcript_9968/g.14108 Transcript_9968/m.14108 type:complete len:105 (-) Transcript_9968:3098-3412(-)